MQQYSIESRAVLWYHKTYPQFNWLHRRMEHPSRVAEHLIDLGHSHSVMSINASFTRTEGICNKPP